MNETDKIVDINNYCKEENYKGDKQVTYNSYEEHVDAKFDILHDIVGVVMYASLLVFLLLGLFVNRLFVILNIITEIFALIIVINDLLKARKRYIETK